MTLATPPLRKILRGHVQTVPGNMLIKCEVRSFNHFKLVRLTGLLCTDTHTQTHIEQNSISAIHSIHLAEINMWLNKATGYHCSPKTWPLKHSVPVCNRPSQPVGLNQVYLFTQQVPDLVIGQELFDLITSSWHWDQKCLQIHNTTLHLYNIPTYLLT